MRTLLLEPNILVWDFVIDLVPIKLKSNTSFTILNALSRFALLISAFVPFTTVHSSFYLFLIFKRNVSESLCTYTLSNLFKYGNAPWKKSFRPIHNDMLNSRLDSAFCVEKFSSCALCSFNNRSSSISYMVNRNTLKKIVDYLEVNVISLKCAKQRVAVRKERNVSALKSLLGAVELESCKGEHWPLKNITVTNSDATTVDGSLS